MGKNHRSMAWISLSHNTIWERPIFSTQHGFLGDAMDSDIESGLMKCISYSVAISGTAQAGSAKQSYSLSFSA